ncbi:MAG: M24 family metallopeptidase [Hyphomicrobiaceae bacterium]|nr:MAG: M24 family metallopeptidase [Hyphomicrobiaceae bacterium]
MQPFTADEYRSRVAKVRAAMAKRGLDALIVSDIANQAWLTGVEGWSFYMPQVVVVPANGEEPMWIGRQMDVPGARMTGWMQPERSQPFPETLVHRRDVHPCQHIAKVILEHGYGKGRIGYESDAYYLSPRGFEALKTGLSEATLVDADTLVNWERLVKSPAEIALMREAARLVEAAFNVAYQVIAPGVRQCDAAAEISRAQIGGNRNASGDIPSLPATILAGRMASTAHPAWTAEPFEPNQVVALELAGACRRYTTPLARTMHLGSPPQKVMDTHKAVAEGLEALLAILKAGVTPAEVHAAWQSVLDRYGLKKESRIGYSIGIGYPPDWGERTISIRPGERTPLPANATIHMMLGMWADGWGLELSESIVVKDGGYECLAKVPREVFVMA